MKVAIVGVGAYSVALASMLCKKDNDVMMWTESQERYDKYLNDGCIKDVIPGYSLPSSVVMSTSKKDTVLNAQVVIIASIASFVGEICNDIKEYIKKDTTICIASKGIENKSCRFLSDIASDILNVKNIAILSGPSFAIDMVNNNPIGLSLASHSDKAIRVIKDILQNDRLKLRETRDLIGIQICGSIKNVLAVAAGILNGLGYPESTQTFLITESLHDVKALIKALGGNPKTILAFAGVGDILLTCSSVKSRNYSFGILIGQNGAKFDRDSYVKNNTVEGYYTLHSIYKLVKKKKIKMPIIDLIYKIVVLGNDPQLLVNFLINKE